MIKAQRGPWSLHPDGYINDANGDSLRLITPWIDNAWNDDPTALANGKLAAAAPELLATLEEVDFWLEAHAGLNLKASIRCTIHAAIAKATGG